MHCPKCGIEHEQDGWPAIFCRECGEPFVGLQRRRGFLATIIAGIVGAPFVAKASIEAKPKGKPKGKTVIVRNGAKLKAGDLGDIDTLIIENGDVEIGNLRKWEPGGTFDHDWNDTSNWSGGVVPKAGDVVTFGVPRT